MRRGVGTARQAGAGGSSRSISDVLGLKGSVGVHVSVSPSPSSYEQTCARRNTARRNTRTIDSLCVLLVRRARFVQLDRLKAESWGTRSEDSTSASDAHESGNVTVSEIRVAMSELRGFTLGYAFGTTSGWLVVMMTHRRQRAFLEHATACRWDASLTVPPLESISKKGVGDVGSLGASKSSFKV